MKLNREKSIPKIVISRLIGLIIFIILLILVNNFLYTTNQTALNIISFLNDNLTLIIVMSLIFLLADIIYALAAPLNFAAPIISAVGSIFVVMFIFRIFLLIDLLIGQEALSYILWTRWIVYPIVFIAVLVSGYVSVVFGFFTSTQAGTRKEKTKDNIIDITPRKKKSWQDVGDEFRRMLFDIFSSARRKLKRKK